jgi:cell wall-associated NlpC family hydrolase
LRVKHLILTSIAALAVAAPEAASAAGAAGVGGTGGSTTGGSTTGGSTTGGSTTGGSTTGGSTTGGSTTSTTPATGASGGVGLGRPTPRVSAPAHPTVPGFVGKIVDGIAYAPSYAPIQVQEAIWAGNQIRRKPYIWGGGHAKFKSAGYDCSGAVSFVLHAAHLLKLPHDSSDFITWGQKGVGQWITVYTNPDHAFIEIAGIRFDTSAEADPHPASGSGPRWRPLFQHPAGFQARHPVGY